MSSSGCNTVDNRGVGQQLFDYTVHGENWNKPKTDVVNEIVSIILLHPDAYIQKTKDSNSFLFDEYVFFDALNPQQQKQLSKCQLHGVDFYKTIMTTVGIDNYLKFIGDTLYSFSIAKLCNIRDTLNEKYKQLKEKQTDAVEDYYFIDINTTDPRLVEIIEKIDRNDPLEVNDLVYIENNQRFYNNFGSKKIRISKRKKSEGKKMEGKVGFKKSKKKMT